MGPLGVVGLGVGEEHAGPLQSGAGDPGGSVDPFVGGLGGGEALFGLVVAFEGGGQQAEVVGDAAGDGGRDRELLGIGR